MRTTLICMLMLLAIPAHATGWLPVPPGCRAETRTPDETVLTCGSVADAMDWLKREIEDCGELGNGELVAHRPDDVAMHVGFAKGRITAFRMTIPLRGTIAIPVGNDAQTVLAAIRAAKLAAVRRNTEVSVGMTEKTITLAEDGTVIATTSLNKPLRHNIPETLFFTPNGMPNGKDQRWPAVIGTGDGDVEISILGGVYAK